MSDTAPQATKQDGSCPQCQAAYVAGDRFCRNCGTQLGGDTQAIEAYLSRVVPDRIDAAIASRFRDLKVVEVETAQRLAERAMGWLKLGGFFVGIPLLVCGVALSLLGIKTYSDLQSAAEKAANLAPLAAGAEKQLVGVQKRVEEMDAALKTAQTRIDTHLAQLERQQQSLQAQVQNIQERLHFCPSKSLTAELRNALQQRLSQYIANLEKIGFTKLDDRVSVCLYSKEDPIQEPSLARYSDRRTAFYMLDARTIYIHIEMAADHAVALREYSHYAMFNVAPQLKNVGVAEEMEYGLVDYFPLSFIGTPMLGEGLGGLLKLRHSYIRNLANDDTYAAVPSDPFSRAAVWGGALWHCRGQLGRDAMDKIALRAWSDLNEHGNRPDLPQRFIASLEKYEREAVPGRTTSCIAEQATQRGLPR